MYDFDLSGVTVTGITYASKFNPAPHYERYGRPHFGIFYNALGSCRAVSDGQNVLFDPLHVVLLPKDSTYRIDVESAALAYVIEFDCADGFVWDKNRISSWTLRDAALIASLFTEAERIWTFKKTAYFPRCMSILYKIFSELERESVYISSPGREKLRTALACVESRIADPDLSVNDLADAAGMSRSYFTRLFTEVYNIPPAKYLAMIRLEKAKALLSEGGLSVGEVAESVGYSSLYYFSSAFRRQTGVCPSEFADGRH